MSATHYLYLHYLHYMYLYFNKCILSMSWSSGPELGPDTDERAGAMNSGVQVEGWGVQRD